MQAEYATDIVFRRPEDLKPVYEELVRTLTHTVKPEHLATFLGRKLHGNCEGELGSRFAATLKDLDHFAQEFGDK